ncbi:hypothetical protein ACP70R_035058 [Stipagrostis hirtigluma subsp. patula]
MRRRSLSDALAAARMEDKLSSLSPGRLSPVSPLARCGMMPTRSSSSGSLGSAPRTPGVPSGANGSAGSRAATSTLANALPLGNVCPSGRLPRSPAPWPRAARRDVLGCGTRSYGHGSVVRGRCGGVAVAADAVAEEGAPMRRHASPSAGAEEVRRAGNEQYKKGCFEEALRLYDRALAMSPGSAACHANRAAALTGLGRLSEAVQECEEALRLDPAYARAHQRLVSLLIRLGQFMDARKQISSSGLQPDLELHKLETVEKHLMRCLEARKVGNWSRALSECDNAIATGVDSCALLFASRAEALLKIHKLDEADLAISRASKLHFQSSCTLDMKFYGFQASSYIYYVHAQVDMSLGRFDTALASVEKARRIDSANVEVITLCNSVTAVAQARSLGNQLFHSAKYAEACIAYGGGLKHHPENPVLYCNRAACRFKLGQWEKSIEDCDEALKIQPNYTKALLRRAASYGKIERWEDCVKDYEILRKALPGDTGVAEACFHAQVALRSSQGQEVSNIKFGREFKR